MSQPGASSAATPARFTFRKAERLCSRRLLDGLFKHGIAFNTYPLRFVVWRTGAGTVVSGKAKPLDSTPEVAEAADEVRNDESSNSKLETRNLKLQVVLGVSKRHFKRAHDRNRIKRLLREAWRHEKSELTTKLTDATMQFSPAEVRPLDPLLIGVLYIGKEKPESLAYLTRRLRKGLDRLRAELPSAPPPSAQ